LINRQPVIAEVENLERIVATLSLKEMTQSTLIRKLCALPQGNSVRKAVFEFDRLVRAIYTIDYHPRSSAAGGCSQIAEPDRVLSSAARGDRSGRGCAGGTDLDVAIGGPRNRYRPMKCTCRHATGDIRVSRAGGWPSPSPRYRASSADSSIEL
jgi:hypothetical protein